MRAAGIAAVMLHVPDVPAALAWYQRLFPDAVVQALDAEGVGCLRIGDARLELVRADAKVPSGAAGSVVYWEVAAFSAALAHALACGAVLYRGPMDIEDDRRMAQVLDPWGNSLGLRGP